MGKAGNRVVVLGCKAEPAECPLSEWVCAEVLEEEPALKAVFKAAGAAAFNEVHFYSPEGDRTAKYSGKKTLGYFFPAGGLAEALKTAGRKAGVDVIEEVNLADLRLTEDSISFGGAPPLAAKLLLAACSRPAEIISHLGMPASNVPRGVLMVTAIDAAWTSTKSRSTWARRCTWCISRGMATWPWPSAWARPYTCG